MGKDHETIGSDILSVLSVVADPSLVVAADMAQRLASVTPAGWYPISWMLDLMEMLDERLGAMALRQMGRAVFRNTHAERVRQTCVSALDILGGLDDMYHHANRGEEIGGWAVQEFGPGHAVVEKTTPHHCGMEEGILSEALMIVGVPAVVTQTECFRKGAGSCVFHIASSFTRREWSGHRTI